ncbi:Ktr system potassium uptake protein B [Metamycoplasma cloacale]|uniref:TrkH family potassium uptake protein n=1 Tax=Metamycoplasma cloacale TaxID=92401 RepID=A0A2Z4LLP6_9BACT|nr:potassium transporter TrkG [Metamycoplasma cloacale]AWX42636.1 TrkH family potassium uptake protein [Metamycoplasma cloacale]VEU79588.1 Ktr system potassium uptake protein B [Metamycoplasma cloacale]
MKKKTNIIKGTNKFILFIKRMGPIKHIFIVYTIVVLIASLLLFWPATHSESMNTVKPDFDYSDALFIASSSFSDTGLTTLSISKGFNSFGQAIIAIAIFLGGLGIFAIKVYIMQNIFGIKMSIFNNQVSQAERGSNTWGDTKKLIKVSITFLLIILLISTIIFTIIFYFSPYSRFYIGTLNNPDINKNDIIENLKNIANTNNIKDYQLFNPYETSLANPYHRFDLSLKYAVFHSISSLCNAGFDIIGSKSLQPYYFDYALQIFTALLIFIGGVGYPVIYDCYLKLKSINKKNKKHNFSLFTKLTLITWLIITVIGFTLTIIFEATSKNPNSYWHQEQYGNGFNKTFGIFFQVVSTRSAGFSTVDYYHFTDQTILIHAILMFIGFSPVSTAGGIRNITIAIIFLSIITMLRGKKSIVAFKRQIGKETLIKAINIFAIGLFLIFIGTLTIHASYLNDINTSSIKTYSLVHVVFETCSAFGNSGLSSGITTEVGLLSKFIWILLMFIGQLGIQQTILIWGKTNKKPEYYKYIYEDVSVG